VVSGGSYEDVAALKEKNRNDHTNIRNVNMKNEGAKIKKIINS